MGDPNPNQPQQQQFVMQPMPPYPYQQQQPMMQPVIMQQPMYQQPMYAPQPMYAQQPIVIQQQPAANPNVTVNVIDAGPPGKFPQAMMCPNCKEMVTSKVTNHPNKNTHMTACFLCIVGWPLCLCTVPYCMSKCKSQRHTCPKCGEYLGENDDSSSQICCYACIAVICCGCADGSCFGECCENCGDCGDCGGCDGCGDCIGGALE